MAQNISEPTVYHRNILFTMVVFIVTLFYHHLLSWIAGLAFPLAPYTKDHRHRVEEAPCQRPQECPCMSRHMWVHMKEQGGEESSILLVKGTFDLS